VAAPEEPETPELPVLPSTEIQPIPDLDGDVTNLDDQELEKQESIGEKFVRI